MKKFLVNLVTALGITVLIVGVLFGVLFGITSWEQKESEKKFNDGVCTICEVGNYEFSNTTKNRHGHVSYFYNCDNCGHVIDLDVQMRTEPKEKAMTVDEFVSLPGDFYYIVKAEGDWGVLESDVYMDREVVEVAVCEDAENTICLFIQLEENEEPHYRNN